METVTVYQAINKVQQALSHQGVAKNQKNKQGEGYKFRGIDDIYNALSPLLAENGLVVLPRMLSRQCDERKSSGGKALFYVTVHAEFDFVSSIDGSKHTVSTFGEAMDLGDKATNKAMSAAYKYAAFQAFCIPTEGDNDADASTHEVISTVFITEHEAANIEALAGEVNKPVKDILDYYKVKELTDIQSKDYHSIIKTLERKRADSTANK